MIGEYVSTSRVLDIVAAENVPGLYDVTLEDGTQINDLTISQTQALISRNGIVHLFRSEGGDRG